MTTLSFASSLFQPVMHKLQAGGEVDVALQKGEKRRGRLLFLRFICVLHFDRISLQGP